MILTPHKLTIALLLSGVGHGLFLYASFDDEYVLQSPDSQMNALQLEFISMAVADHSSKYQEQSVKETSTDSLVAQEKVAQKRALHRNETNKIATDESLTDPLANSVKDRQQWKKQLSKPVENQDVLMQLVYRAINQHKHYPYMARRLGQQGKVSVNFVMHPDGQVTDVVVVESSRYSVLDRAAEQAVVAISPFAMAAEYLNYEKVFDIAVDFRLN